MAPKTLTLPHGDLRLPVFLPDATRGVVRAVDADDLLACRVRALQMNVYHLMQKPGTSTIKNLGGLHRLSGWPLPIITDSGGFQVYSLIRQNPKFGALSDRGAVFRPEGSTRKFQLTPEKSIQLQVGYGADIVVCFDDCTHAQDAIEEQRKSVARTIDWARRCKREFERLLDEKQTSVAQRPLLFAVVQGGASRELRKLCAEALLEIGFDGYGYGGWPVDDEGRLLEDVFAYLRERIPAGFPLHALGVGHPSNIVQCALLGYDLFDSTMPTRDARHGRLYRFNDDPAALALDGTNDWFAYVYVRDKKHVKTNEPVSPYCDCLCCTKYTLGYLHHLDDVNDGLFQRLATMHNLRFITQVVDRLAQTLPRFLGGQNG
jgi:queuine tRNA-ribosyltransferase